MPILFTVKHLEHTQQIAQSVCSIIIEYMRKKDLGLPPSRNLDQQSSIFLAPGTSFIEDNFFTDWG